MIPTTFVSMSPNTWDYVITIVIVFVMLVLLRMLLTMARTDASEIQDLIRQYKGPDKAQNLLAEPHIKWDHVDGPMLVCRDGSLHWPTRIELILVKLDLVSLTKLDQRYQARSK